MTTPPLSHATSWGRMYGRHIGDTPRVPSITTVQGMEPELEDPGAKIPLVGVKPHGGALIAWRARLVQDATVAYLRNDHETLQADFPHVLTAVDHARQRGRSRDGVGRAARDAIAATPDVVAQQAAERGDRVHNFAEAIGNWQTGVGGRADVDACRIELDAHGENGYAETLVDWWMRWGVEAVDNEATVWNHQTAVAGTLDIVFRIEGRLFVGDFKTKSDRGGFAKPMQAKVGMQLVNALHADERIVDAETGAWAPWSYGRPDGLVAIAVSPTEVVPKAINPQTWEALWAKFTHLRQVWQDYRDVDMGRVLQSVRPPSSAAQWPDDVRAELPAAWTAGSVLAV
ncbi:MAG: hypothetical protein L0H59_01095 [Tomitella sp.]|nr:hypothetical protein [Tomitella sp.]